MLDLITSPVFQIIFYLVLLISVASFVSLAPWVPTKRSDLKRVKEVVKLKPGERFLEMGCGTAGVSLYMAQEHPEARITGIELSPFFWLISKVRVSLSGLKNIEIYYGNALKLDLGSYDAVYVFGLPETVTNKILPKLSKVVNKDFRFISYCFKMTNKHFKETRHKPEGEFSIYEYRVEKK